MAVSTSVNNEYAEYIQSQRNWLAEVRGAYEKAIAARKPENAEEVLKRIVGRLMMVTADSEPHKAVWCVAQCREIMSSWSEEEAMISKFEKIQKKVEQYDRSLSQKGESM